jgi:DNA-binding response OmpR family regulator
LTPEEGAILAKLALVDRNPSTREELTRLLQAGGYDVEAFGHWREAKSALQLAAVDAVVLCDWLRLGGRGSHRYLWRVAGIAPFVLVCDGGVTRWDDRFMAVLYYPVNSSDLLGAIEAAIRGANQSLTLGGYRLDLRRRRLVWGESQVRLTRIETALLRELMLAQGRFVESTPLMTRAWGEDLPSDRRALYTHIAWLRRKLLTAFADRKVITNARGQGYRFDPSQADSPDATIAR